MERPVTEAPSYSSDLEMWMDFNGVPITLAQVGADVALAKDPIDVPAGSEVQISIRIDGAVHTRRVCLDSAMSLETPWVKLKPAAAPF